MKRGVSLYIAAPPFLILLVCYFLPYTLTGALTLSVSYFFAYATLSEELKEKTRHRRYRFSFLRFLMGILSVWDYFRRGQYLSFKRLITPLLFSLIQVAMMGLYYWYLPLCALAGWGIFEIYYKKFLKAKMDELRPIQRDDHETLQGYPSAESVSEVLQDSQNPQTDSEKNS